MTPVKHCGNFMHGQEMPGPADSAILDLDQGPENGLLSGFWWRAIPRLRAVHGFKPGSQTHSSCHEAWTTGRRRPGDP